MICSNNIKSYSKECSDSNLPNYLRSIDVEQITNDFGTKYKATIKWRDGYQREMVFNSIEELNKEFKFYFK